MPKVAQAHFRIPSGPAQGLVSRVLHGYTCRKAWTRGQKHSKGRMVECRFTSACASTRCTPGCTSWCSCRSYCWTWRHGMGVGGADIYYELRRAGITCWRDFPFSDFLLQNCIGCNWRSGDFWHLVCSHLPFPHIRWFKVEYSCGKRGESNTELKVQSWQSGELVKRYSGFCLGALLWQIGPRI